MSNFYFHLVPPEFFMVCWCGVSMESELKGPPSPLSCSVNRSTIKLLPLTLTPTLTRHAHHSQHWWLQNN